MAHGFIQESKTADPQTSFGLTFASFLLFWGRFADLYSPKPVFCGSFLTFGVLNLIVSFLDDKFSFLILRALAGVSAAALIPASYRLITAVFEKHELPRAFTVYSLSGSMAGACGVMFGGLVMLIPNGGQMMGWRWFFRITSLVVYVPLSCPTIWSADNQHPNIHLVDLVYPQTARKLCQGEGKVEET